MKLLSIILSILITIIHLLRFNLPSYWNNISVFDTLDIVAWILMILVVFLRQKSIILSTLFIFNLIGAFNQLIDELFFDPTRRGPSDYIILGFGILTSVGYFIYHQITNQNEWNQKSNLKNPGG